MNYRICRRSKGKSGNSVSALDGLLLSCREEIQMSLEYMLTRDDYADWIIWNIRKRDKRKIRLYLWGIFAICAVAFLGLTLVNGGKGDIPIALFLVVLCGAALVYGSSDKQQFRLMMKRTGVKKMEKENTFPHLNARFNEKGFEISARDQNYRRQFSYSDIKGIEESKRLILIQTDSNMYQMIAKSAFSTEESRQRFMKFLQERYEDARKNPLRYDQSVNAAVLRYKAEKKADSDNRKKVTNLGSLAHLDLKDDGADNAEDNG
jgi:hypothetical protein